jgi:hypothetical protein
MTTLQLIREWSMEGATRDPEGRFRSADELRAAFSRRRAKPAASPVTDALPVQQADEAHIVRLPVRRSDDRT